MPPSSPHTCRPISGFTFAIVRRTAAEPGDDAVVGASGDRVLRASFAGCPGRGHLKLSAVPPMPVCVLGDPQDFDGDREQFLGHGVLIHVDTSTGCASVRTSLSGVPPVFVYEDGIRSVVASSLDRIVAVPAVRLAFDPQGLLELATIGQPIKHRTLFAGVSVAPAGACLAIDAARGVRRLAGWQPPADPPFADPRDYVAAQAEALAAAMSRIDMSGSFLSLTAGLDSRTILALLVREGRTLPALTLSAACTSLDARRAAELCRGYGIPHRIVRLDDTFVRMFPECVREASRRSGGLASFRQAAEVFLYRSACYGYQARLSGNLGNQVGRSGPESATMRGVDPGILAAGLRADGERQRNGHWFAEICGGAGGVGPLELIQQESLFASLGNFSIGSSFATQQTPYADRTVIVQKLREPVERSKAAPTPVAMRSRDLKHRFFGDPIRISFQRKIIVDIGGVVARSPVNWGWRPAGSVSIGGAALGALALLDMAVNTRMSRGGMASLVTARAGLDGFSGFQYVDLMREPTIAEFVQDTLRGQRSPAIDQRALRRALDLGFDDRAARAALLFALDVVLAQENFGVGG